MTSFVERQVAKRIPPEFHVTIERITAVVHRRFARDLDWIEREMQGSASSPRIVPYCNGDKA